MDEKNWLVGHVTKVRHDLMAIKEKTLWRSVNSWIVIIIKKYFKLISWVCKRFFPQKDFKFFKIKKIFKKKIFFLN